VIRKREPRWQSAAERARVAAELIEEAESLTETSTIASPADVARASLPPPIRVDLPPGVPAASSPEPAPVPPTIPAPAAREPGAVAAAGGELAEVAQWLDRAGRLASGGHYAAARREYERVLTAAPAHGDALTGLGVLLSRRGLWHEAVAQLRRAAAADPGRAAAWSYLGEALNRVDDLPGAREAYERAVELEPRNAKALYGLGIVLDRLNRPEEATRMYRRSREATAT
jgi:tetratricopeptide (TPR) repeat protein